MAPQSHLHEETQVLPVKAHTAMLATQHLLACHLPEHPGQRLLEKPSPPRKMKPTLVSAHDPRLEHLLEGVDLPLPTKEYRRLLKTVHTETVATTTQSYPPSGVLGTRPPPVHFREEKTLPRRTRRTLSQLRSGYSQHLLSYRARLEPDQESSCPLCHTSPTRLPTCSSAPQTPLTSPSLTFGQTRWKPPVSLTWPGYTPQCRAPARGNYNNNKQIHPQERTTWTYRKYEEVKNLKELQFRGNHSGNYHATQMSEQIWCQKMI